MALYAGLKLTVCEFRHPLCRIPFGINSLALFCANANGSLELNNKFCDGASDDDSTGSVRMQAKGFGIDVQCSVLDRLEGSGALPAFNPLQDSFHIREKSGLMISRHKRTIREISTINKGFGPNNHIHLRSQLLDEPTGPGKDHDARPEMPHGAQVRSRQFWILIHGMIERTVKFDMMKPSALAADDFFESA